ncbi:MAG: hypothetical protein K8T89_05115 [Planctomycetes bacterium]|nr:hypothetical protein [Planctomycetota bacterium]
MLENNFAWGNETADIKIKTGYEYFHEVKNCVSPGYYSTTNVENCLIGRESGDKVRPADTIILGKETKLDLRSEFADPDHHDYRLQATSRFRGKGVDGKDRGPFPYAKNIYYVRTDGDDSADGLSVRDAWKSLARAVQNLKAGDTVYLDPGVYKADLDVQAAGKEGAPISFRGRGTGRTVIQGAVRIKESSNVEFLRLSFRDEVKIEKSREIVVDQCVFTSTTTALETVRVNKLKVTHCLFTGFQQAGINLKIGISRADLSGNIFDNAKGVALQFFFDDPPRYSNYNSYRDTAKAWEEDGKKLKFAEVQKGHEQHSLQLTPEFEAIDGIPVLKNAAQFAARGPHGKPIGPYQDKPRERELRLAVKPAVHSVSATTANLEWMTTLPATCQLAWGETPACEKAVPYSINCFGTYSLTGLKPGQRYYFRIKSIEPPTDMLPKVESKPIAINDEPITFTTLDKNPAPAVYYVAPDGNDEYTGLDRQKAWKTIRHAAAKVNVGDTVQIAGGKYSERIRIRATGDSGSPITFRAMTGERVDIDGNDLALHSGFVVSGKNNLHFDGLYFANFNMFPNDGWNFQRSGEFLLNNSKDIEISRCFSEGRGTYTASSVVAFYVENLHIKNCVNTYKMTGAMYLYRCPNLLIENTVFAAPMVMSFVLRNEKTQKATMTNCVFTDMLEKKAKFNIALLCVDGYVDSFRHRNNCYFVRVFSPEERILLGNSPIGKLSEYISEPLFADPQFAGDPGVKGNPKDKSGHGPDRMMDAGLKLDFNSFFATNPDLIKRGIGLQPEAFKDFHFNKATKP